MVELISRPNGRLPFSDTRLDLRPRYAQRATRPPRRLAHLSIRSARNPPHPRSSSSERIQIQCTFRRPTITYQTCKRMQQVSALRIVWTNAYKQQILPRRYPFPDVSIEDLSVPDLERKILHAYRLGSWWSSEESSRSVAFESEFDATNGTPVSDVRFVPGHEGKWLLSVSKGIWSSISLWELSDTHGVPPLKRFEWSPPNCRVQSFLVNGDTASDATLAVSLYHEGYVSIHNDLLTSTTRRSRAHVEILSLREDEGFRSICTIDWDLRPCYFHGDILVLCDLCDLSLIINWKTSASAVLQPPQQSGMYASMLSMVRRSPKSHNTLLTQHRKTAPSKSCAPPLRSSSSAGAPSPYSPARSSPRAPQPYTPPSQNTRLAGSTASSSPRLSIPPSTPPPPRHPRYLSSSAPSLTTPGHPPHTTRWTCTSCALPPPHHHHPRRPHTSSLPRTSRASRARGDRYSAESCTSARGARPCGSSRGTGARRAFCTSMRALKSYDGTSGLCVRGLTGGICSTRRSSGMIHWTYREKRRRARCARTR